MLTTHKFTKDPIAFYGLFFFLNLLFLIIKLEHLPALHMLVKKRSKAIDINDLSWSSNRQHILQLSPSLQQSALENWGYLISYCMWEAPEYDVPTLCFKQKNRLVSSCALIFVQNNRIFKPKLYTDFIWKSHWISQACFACAYLNLSLCLYHN